MQVHILASGSTGNVAFFKFGHTQLLVDVGISARSIENKLAQIGVNAGNLDGVLITHEHIDHIKGLDVFIRRYHLPVFARAATWEAIACRHKLPAECCITIEDEFSIGKVGVAAYSISHDAADPVGFAFYFRDQKWVIATDIGVITKSVLQALNGADLVVLEANHDRDMLKNGPYPRFLKQRIMGKYGHLSNDEAAAVLAKIGCRNKMQVFLAHLSQKNNLPGLALKTVNDHLQQKGVALGKDIKISLTYPDTIMSFTG